MTYSASPSHLQLQRCEQIIFDLNRDDLNIPVFDERAIQFQPVPIKTHKAIVRQDQPCLSGLDMGTIKTVTAETDNLRHSDMRHTPRRSQAMRNGFGAFVTKSRQFFAHQFCQCHQKKATRKTLRAAKSPIELMKSSPLKWVFIGDVAGSAMSERTLPAIMHPFLFFAIPRRF